MASMAPPFPASVPPRVELSAQERVPAPGLCPVLRSRRGVGGWRAPCLLLVLLAVAGALPAIPAAEGEWQPAELWGADVRAFALHPDDPDLVLAGTSGGQLYLSRDGGASWADVAPRQPFLGWVVSALAFDPNRPGRLWAGLWGVWGGGMVASSDDLGVTWTPRSDGLPGQVYSLALVPGREGWLYAGTRQGVWGTSDGGAGWHHLMTELPRVGKVTSLLVDRFHPDTVYAGSWRRAYRSDDGGLTWRGIFEGMALDSEVFSLEPVPGRPTELWASTCGWVYHTPDGGGRWTRHKEGLASRRTPSFQVLPDGRLLAGTVGGLYLSADGGESWRRVTRPELAVLAIAVHPDRPRRVLLGTEGSGVWRSTDGGESFATASRGMTNVRVAALARTGREVLAAVSHAGPASGIWSSIDDGRTFQHQLPDLPTVLALAAAADGRVYAATEGGLYERTPALEWRQVAELEGRRVDGVEAGDGRVVARTSDGLFERREGRFTSLPYRHGAPRSALPLGGALWVADGDGLYRLAGAENHAVATPAAGGRLAALGGELLLAGKDGAWARAGLEAPWRRLGDGDTRALPTSSESFPMLLVAGGGARLFDQRTGALLPLDLPIPTGELTGALVTGDTLLLATSGYGVIRRALGELVGPISK